MKKSEGGQWKAEMGTRCAAQTSEPNALRKIVHKVKVGETLNKIASAYKTSVAAILSWNKPDNLNVIHPGDQLTIFLGDGN